MVFPSLFNFVRGWVRGVKAWLHSTNWFSVLVAVFHLHHLYLMIHLKMLKTNLMTSSPTGLKQSLPYIILCCDL